MMARSLLLNALAVCATSGVLGMGTTATARAQSAPAMTVSTEPFRARVATPVSTFAPASAVALAFGNVGIVSTDADVLFYNPGMLLAARGMSASVQRYGGQGTTASFASAQTFGAYGVAIGARVADWRSEASRLGDALRDGLSALGNATGRNASSLALTAGAARALGPLRVGASATFARETFREQYDDATLFDFGVALPTGNTTLALSVQRVGTGVTIGDFTSDAPWRATVGYGGWNYPLATFFDAGATVQVSVDEDGTIRTAGGAELTYVPVEGFSIATRLGSRSPVGGESVVTGGVGVSLDRYSLDYAIEPARRGGVGHRVGLRIR